MGGNVEICARCEQLKTGGDPDKIKRGQGYCRGYEDDSSSRGPFATWNDSACVLFIRAKDMALRERWIEWRQVKREQLQVKNETRDEMNYSSFF